MFLFWSNFFLLTYFLCNFRGWIEVYGEGLVIQTFAPVTQFDTRTDGAGVSASNTDCTGISTDSTGTRTNGTGTDTDSTGITGGESFVLL